MRRALARTDSDWIKQYMPPSQRMPLFPWDDVIASEANTKFHAFTSNVTNARADCFVAGGGTSTSVEAKYPVPLAFGTAVSGGLGHAACFVASGASDPTWAGVMRSIGEYPVTNQLVPYVFESVVRGGASIWEEMVGSALTSCAKSMTYLTDVTLPDLRLVGTGTAPSFAASSARELVAALRQLLADCRPSGSDAEDRVTSAIEEGSSEFGEDLVSAVEILINAADVSWTDKERLVKALGSIRRPPAAVSHSSEILGRVLSHEHSQMRDAAVSAMAVGAAPEDSAAALVEAASKESITLLKSAMLQTAEQLLEWGRRRAAMAQSRTEKMAQHGP